VPKVTFAGLLALALNPPATCAALPFTADATGPRGFGSRCCCVRWSARSAGVRSGEDDGVRFFAPGSLVSNLDFVESIFGNAAIRTCRRTTRRWMSMHWTGHTGCVILAPHLSRLRKKDLGLPAGPNRPPNAAAARRDVLGSEEDELYNDGGAFKVTCRDHRGVMVTLIADNYYGYCKKEVKTQISYAANLFGCARRSTRAGRSRFPPTSGQEFFAGRQV
jgi:phosphoenolpyruvate carboxykinase (diphosphate)